MIAAEAHELANMNMMNPISETCREIIETIRYACTMGTMTVNIDKIKLIETDDPLTLTTHGQYLESLGYVVAIVDVDFASISW